jgi:hypothetical protein
VFHSPPELRSRILGAVSAYREVIPIFQEAKATQAPFTEADAAITQRFTNATNLLGAALKGLTDSFSVGAMKTFEPQLTALSEYVRSPTWQELKQTYLEIGAAAGKAFSWLSADLLRFPQDLANAYREVQRVIAGLSSFGKSMSDMGLDPTTAQWPQRFAETIKSTLGSLNLGSEGASIAKSLFFSISGAFGSKDWPGSAPG